MKTSLCIAFFLVSLSSIAQVSITNNGSQPDSSAMLDIKSTTRGLLVPRMTAMQRTAITSPATGLLVYQIDDSEGYYYFDGNEWYPLAVRTESGFSGTVFDVEGNTYRTVIIGDQEWFAENLRTTHFANGENISYGLPSGTSAYAWYNWDISHKIPYGALYNYYAVVDGRGLCPTGWKVPSNNDWSVLKTYLGGGQNAAISMLSADLWLGPTTFVTNSTGFSGVPGGRLHATGGFNNLGWYSYFWSTTEVAAPTAKAWQLIRSPNPYFSTEGPGYIKSSGYSVRCMKGNPCELSQSIAGDDQLHLPGNTATLQGNAPLVGTGQWIISGGTGGNIADPTNPNSLFTGISGTTYSLTWKITSTCGTSQDIVRIGFQCSPQPTIANAGSDQLNLSGTTTTLQGNVPLFGSGNWEIVSNDGTGYIASPSNPASAFNGVAGHTYILQWTITGCDGDAYEDIVVISFGCSSPPANAGPDFSAPYEYYILEGNDPGPGGTGYWQQINPPCPVYQNGQIVQLPGLFIDPYDPHSGFVARFQCAYTLRWTTTSPCGITTYDDMVITASCIDHLNASHSSPSSTSVDITGDSTLYPGYPGYPGYWTIIKGYGGSIANPNNAHTTLTGPPGSSFGLLWRVDVPVIPSGICHSAAYVDVDLDCPPTTPIANAGPDQLNLQGTNTTLQGNLPGGVGHWINYTTGGGGIVAEPYNPNSLFTGSPGNTYNLVWNIETGPGCGYSSSDEVIIHFLSCPSIASNAGTDQINLPGTSTTLQANTPAGGNFQWSVVSGTGGIISAPTNPASTFTGLAGISYVLRWTVSNECVTLTDDVNISFQCVPQPTPSNAGPDQLNIVGLSATLQANTPTSGTGQWSIVSGTGGNITTPTNPASMFTGIEGNSYTLRWTITACTTSVDNVVISFACPVANAGPDQLQLPGTSATLAATVPFAGTGVWTIDGGIGGNITQPSNPMSPFNGLEGISYNLRWTVTSNCPSSFDNVIVSFQCANPPTTANAGPDQLNVQGASTTLQGNTPVVGSGIWIIQSGAGGFLSQATSPTSTFIGLAGTTYLLAWTITSGNCVSGDQVTISLATFTCGNTFVDTRDYKVYPTVQIGTRCWMKQNLNYAFGSSSCFGGSQTNCDNYGRLYDWSTASIACPTGWNLPTDVEWCTLTTTIDPTVACGGTGLTGTDAGGKMKETGFTYWFAPNTGATNSSGFSARGGGSSISGHSLGQWADFWTSTPTGGGSTWSWEMTYNDQRVLRNSYGPSNIMSVRCIKP